MNSLATAFFPGLTDRVPAGPRARPSLLKRFATWRRVARERRQLLDLDPRMLADMGLTADDVAHEAARPFWDVNPRSDR